MPSIRRTMIIDLLAFKDRTYPSLVSARRVDASKNLWRLSAWDDSLPLARAGGSDGARGFFDVDERLAGRCQTNVAAALA